MKRIALSTLALLSSTLACEVRVHEHSDFDDEHWSDDDFDSDSEAEAEATCEPYCLELIDCGVLGDKALSSCLSLCSEKFEENEVRVSAGCSCVIEASCDSSEATACTADPIPGLWPDDDDGNSGSGGAANGGADGVGGDQSATGGDGGGGSPSIGGDSGGEVTCQVNHDCALGEDCVDGSCLGRCVASCQCPEGDACVEGYCREPEVVTASCENDCDCTSGERCIDSACQ
jgi:hypothetical protein